MSKRHYGAKYDEKLSTKEIAALFRADVKEAIAAGTLLPAGLKLSVRIDHFSGGSSIDVTIKAVPKGFLVGNPNHESNGGSGWDVDSGGIGRKADRYAPDARAMLGTLEAMLAAYNHDGSDIMTDYFDVRFYGHVQFDYALTSSTSVAA